MLLTLIAHQTCLVTVVPELQIFDKFQLTSLVTLSRLAKMLRTQIIASTKIHTRGDEFFKFVAKLF